MKTYELSNVKPLKQILWGDLGADDRLRLVYNGSYHGLTRIMAVVGDKGEGSPSGWYSPSSLVVHILWWLHNSVLGRGDIKLTHIMHSGKQSGDMACITLVVENDGRVIDLDLYHTGEVLIGWTDFGAHFGIIETSWNFAQDNWSDLQQWGTHRHWDAIADFLLGNNNDVQAALNDA